MLCDPVLARSLACLAQCRIDTVPKRKCTDKYETPFIAGKSRASLYWCIRSAKSSNNCLPPLMPVGRRMALKLVRANPIASRLIKSVGANFSPVLAKF